MTSLNKDTTFVLCINNAGCDDLELRKIYAVIPDATAEKDDYIRVIDESGEDYLYPASCFVPLDIPLSAREAFIKLADPV
jgi:hypothetical protein